MHKSSASVSCGLLLTIAFTLPFTTAELGSRTLGSKPFQRGCAQGTQKHFKTCVISGMHTQSTHSSHVCPHTHVHTRPHTQLIQSTHHSHSTSPHRHSHTHTQLTQRPHTQSCAHMHVNAHACSSHMHTQMHTHCFQAMSSILQPSCRD